MEMTNNWVNYGDIDFLECGGFFAKQDRDIPTAYHVVQTRDMKYATGKEGYLICTGLIDLTSEWIDWKAVQDYIGVSDAEFEEFPVYKLEGAFFYYGIAEFQGGEIMANTKDEALEILKGYGIEEK